MTKLVHESSTNSDIKQLLYRIFKENIPFMVLDDGTKITFDNSKFAKAINYDDMFNQSEHKKIARA